MTHGTFTDQDLINGLNDLNIIGHNPHNPIYKYVDFKTAKIILESGLIRFAIPSTYPDPNDMSLDLYDFSTTPDERRMYAEQYFSNEDAEKRKFLIELYTRRDMRDVLIPIALSERNNTPVFCGSASHNVPKLWEQYANNEKGVCLGVHIPQSKIVDDTIMFTGFVNYAAKMSPRKYLPLTDLEKILSVMYWVFTKSYRYNIEEEIRSMMYMYVVKRKCTIC
jgi:hypothetical protein